jgi:membrane protein implicated in regulation of membrane protease activity
VFVDGELWRAQAEEAEPLPVGEKVVVTAQEGLLLRVRRAA